MYVLDKGAQEKVQNSANSNSCKKGHKMVFLEKLPIKSNPDYAAGARCDGCRKHVIPSQGFMHCGVCIYDLCSKCAGTNQRQSTKNLFAKEEFKSTQEHHQNAKKSKK